MYLPSLFDRRSPIAWEQAGRLAADAASAAEVERILAEHSPEPLSEAVRQGLADILKRSGEETNTHAN